MPILGDCNHPSASDSNGSHQPGAETHLRPAGVQRNEPAAAARLTPGQRHQADLQPGSQFPHECQQCVGQLTTELLPSDRGPRTTGPPWPGGLDSTQSRPSGFSKAALRLDRPRSGLASTNQPFVTTGTRPDAVLHGERTKPTFTVVLNRHGRVNAVCASSRLSGRRAADRGAEAAGLAPSP